MSATVAIVKLCAIEGCDKAAKNGRAREPDPWHAVAQLADVVSDLLELVA